MSDDTLIDAIETYKLTPEALSDAQLALITKADAGLGKQARERRRSAHSAALGTAVATTIKQALAERDQRIDALAERVLQLEATQAASEPVEIPDGHA